MVFQKEFQGESANFNDLSITNNSPDILATFKYVAIISVNVEYRFSSYKYLHSYKSLTLFYRPILLHNSLFFQLTNTY